MCHALQSTGQQDAARRLIRQRRSLNQIARQLIPAENWFADVSLGEVDLTSIVILCCNQCDFTSRCIESVLRQTQTAYELVLVDNGSTDETAEYLASLRSRAGPERVEIIVNPKNRGYPASCNQALARADGRFVLFLNNDTVVTESWLDGLLARVRDSSRNIGLVGPVSNYAPSPQHVSVDYNGTTSPGDLESSND